MLEKVCVLEHLNLIFRKNENVAMESNNKSSLDQNYFFLDGSWFLKYSFCNFKFVSFQCICICKSASINFFCWILFDFYMEIATVKKLRPSFMMFLG